jgi:hypothetical protein
VIEQGAFTADRQTFRSKVVSPAGARLTMSSALSSGRVLATWIGGLPTTVFSRTTVARAVAITTMPCVLPVTKLPSRRFPLAVAMTPIPKSSAGSEKPLPDMRFSRTRLLCPAIQTPPQGAAADPLRTDVIPSTKVPKELAAMKTPDPQFVDAVMFSTRAS